MERECGNCRHDGLNGGECTAVTSIKAVNCIVRGYYSLFEPIDEEDDVEVKNKIEKECDYCKHDFINGGDCKEDICEESLKCIKNGYESFEPIDKETKDMITKAITIFYNKTLNKYIIIKENINYEILPDDIVLCEDTVYSSDIEKLLK